MPARVKGRFIEPMLLLRKDNLPNDANRWEYQLKFDGYRAIAFKTGGKIHLRSRNDNDFSQRYRGVVRGLEKLPAETVVDGEIVAFDGDGRPSSSSAITSPSMTVSSGSFAKPFMTSEYRMLKSLSFRERK